MVGLCILLRFTTQTTGLLIGEPRTTGSGKPFANSIIKTNIYIYILKEGDAVAVA